MDICTHTEYCLTTLTEQAAAVYFESSTSQRDRLGVNNYKITNDKLMTVFGEVKKVFDYFMVERC